MKIKEIMTSNVIAVSPETSVSKVSDIIYTNRLHGVPVVKRKKVIGIITESDFFLKKYDDIYFPTYIKFLEENQIAKYLSDDLKKKIKVLSEAKAKDIMTKNPLTFFANDDVAALMDKIKDTKFTSFPVINDAKNIIGIVTLADYLGTVRKNSRRMKKRLEKDPVRNIDKIVNDLDNLWQDKVTFISKKKIHTWRGLTFLGLITLALFTIVFVFFSQIQINYKVGNKNFVPLDCQKYSYGPWSKCNKQEIQTRRVIKKFPPNCSEGIVPDLMQSCQ